MWVFEKTKIISCSSYTTITEYASLFLFRHNSKTNASIRFAHLSISFCVFFRIVFKTIHCKVNVSFRITIDCFVQQFDFWYNRTNKIFFVNKNIKLVFDNILIRFEKIKLVIMMTEQKEKRVRNEIFFVFINWWF